MVVTLFRACTLTIAISAFIAISVNAQTSRELVSQAHQTKLDDFDARAQTLANELQLVANKRQSTERKIQQTERDLKEKETDLLRLVASAGEHPTEAQSETIANEQQRIALAELNIKSLMAAKMRFERKEQELTGDLKEIERQKLAIAQDIASAEQRARRQAENRATVVNAELEALRQENDRLRLAMEEEARKAEAAAAEAKRLAALAAKRQAEAIAEQRVIADASSTKTRSAVAPQKDSVQASDELDPSLIVAPGEPPIYQGDDGIKMVIRSRSIDNNIIMQPIAPNLYQAKMKVEPGRAYFDIHKRRYRGFFPDTAKPQTFVFFYDLNGERPVFSVMPDTSSLSNGQSVTDSSAPF